MAAMTDPSDALGAFQAQLASENLPIRRCVLDADLFVLVDEPNGKPRFTYLQLQGRTITALVMLVLVDRIEGIPCFQIGYAVPEVYRNQGRAKKAVAAAILELRDGLLTRAGNPAFYVEAIISEDNTASRHVAAATISVDPVPVTDSPSGKPAFQYVRKITR